MTFLQPLILFGLAAAAIPLVLHLLTLRRLRRIEFSTLVFLKELQRTRIRRLRLRQWLLLVLRTLLVTLVVLAFARPATRGMLPAGWSSARTTALILLDDSYSMTAVDDGGVYLKQAREAAAGILSALKDDDEAALMLFSDRADPGGGEGSAFLRPPAVRRALEAVTPSAVTRPLGEALRAGAGLLARSQQPNREVYVVSDLQNGLFPAADPPEGIAFPPSAHVFVVPIGTKPPRNVSVSLPVFPSSIIDAGRPLALRVTLADRSPEGSLTTSVSSFLNGERMDQRSTQVASRTAVAVDLAVTPRTSGLLSGRVEIEGDDLEFDNARSFALRIPDAVRVLLVGAEPDLRYLQLALLTRASLSGTRFQVDHVSPERWTGQASLDHDVVWVVPAPGGAGRTEDRLREAASLGKGIVLLPGVSMEAYAASLRAVGIRPPQGPPSASGGVRAFGAYDLRHPVFAGMFETPQNERERTVEPVSVQRSVAIGAGPGAMKLIGLSDGDAALIEQRFLGSRVFAFGIGLTPDWSDLPLKGLFVPLVQRMVSYLAQERAIRPDVAAGEEAAIPVVPRAGARWKVVDPSGAESAVTVTAAPDGAVLRYAETRLPGVYRVYDDRTEVDRFAVHVREEESDTTPATAERLERFWKRTGLSDGRVRTIAPGTGIGAAVVEARFGTELWRLFLAAALFVAVAESLVAARFRPSRADGGGS